MWGDESLLPLSEGLGTRGVVQCPRPREMRLSKICRASLLVLSLSYLPSCWNKRSCIISLLLEGRRT